MPTDGISAEKVYEIALAIMNETDADESYRDRVTPIVNVLLSQCYQYAEPYDNATGRAGWKSIDDVSDIIEGVDRTLLLGVMPYGLAAALYLDEDPKRADSWQQQYEEGLLNARRIPQEIGRITDVYGCVTPTSDARW